MLMKVIFNQALIIKLKLHGQSNVTNPSSSHGKPFKQEGLLTQRHYENSSFILGDIVYRALCHEHRIW